jgi:hypothetical protein
LADKPKVSLADLQPQDFLQWRLDPVSKLLLEHLLSEQEKALNHVASETRDGRTLEATLATGGLDALRSLWDHLHPPEPAVSEPEAPFEDPATIKEPT